MAVAVALGLVLTHRPEATRVTTLPTRSVAPSADQPSDTPSNPSGSPSAPPGAGTPSPSSPSPRATATPPQVAAVVPGWQAVESREFVAFDVPPDWKIESPSLLSGFETSGGPHQTVIMHNSATYKRGACDGQSSTYRAKAGFVSPKGQTAGTAAKEISARWATVAGVQTDGSSSPVGPTQVSTAKIAGGSITAAVATTVLTVVEQGDCPAPRMSFTAVSFSVKGQVVVFMLYADRGVSDALPEDIATQVISSLRPI